MTTEDVFKQLKRGGVKVYLVKALETRPTSPEPRFDPTRPLPLVTEEDRVLARALRAARGK